MIVERGETIRVVIRKHWLVFALKALTLVFAALLPLMVLAFLPTGALEAFEAIPRATEVATFLYLVWLIVLWMLCFIMWTNYYLDVWIVTDKRLIDIDQKALFRREVTTTRIEKIQDVTVEVSGVLATLFHFGNLTIHTAGENRDIIIRNAMRPSEAKEGILQAHSAALEEGRRDFV